MGKIVISERQYQLIKTKIQEEIEPTEAMNHNSSIQTVLDGRRDIGFFGGATGAEIEKLKKSGLRFIPIGVNNAYVFYRETTESAAEEKAYQLAKIAKRNDGYLPTKSPEETYVIGVLLGYNKNEVKKFVLQKFPNFKFY